MGVLNGKLNNAKNVSGANSNIPSIHPSPQGNINTDAFVTNNVNGVVGSDIQSVVQNAFIPKMNDTNTRYTIVQDNHNRYKFTLYSTELHSNEWVEVSTVIIPRQTISTGLSNGTIIVDGRDVPVKGLKSAAYKDASTFVSTESIIDSIPVGESQEDRNIPTAGAVKTYVRENTPSSSVLCYPSVSEFPLVGETDKLYIDTTTALTYYFDKENTIYKRTTIDASTLDIDHIDANFE